MGKTAPKPQSQENNGKREAKHGHKLERGSREADCIRSKACFEAAIQYAEAKQCQERKEEEEGIYRQKKE
jgi:hypothetical protein